MYEVGDQEMKTITMMGALSMMMIYLSEKLVKTEN